MLNFRDTVNMPYGGLDPSSVLSRLGFHIDYINKATYIEDHDDLY